jgi:hypothetical protein
MPEWLQKWIPEGWTGTHLLWFSIGLFIVMLVGSILLVGFILVKLPADYFVNNHTPLAWKDRHPVIRWTLIILKNLLGVFLVLLGIVLSLPGVPGQGILTILLGVMMLDFPGRRRFEKWLLSRRGVLNSVNKLRARYGKEPMRLE